MNSIEVGKRLVELTSNDKDSQAIDELYADQIVSIEAAGEGESESQSWEGIEAVREKHAWWNSVATLHSLQAEGPFAGVGDNHFVVRFHMDVTMQEQGRSETTEVGLYTVEDGKIVREVYLPLA